MKIEAAYKFNRKERVMSKSDKPVKIKIKNKYVDRYRKGYPVLLSDAIDNPEALKKEGQIVRLFDDKDRFLGVGYHGLQNKGMGWLLDRDERTVIDKSFFKGKLIKAIGSRKAFFESEDTNAFRVFNGEGDGIGGLIVDYYDGYYVFNFYSNGVYAFKDTIFEAFREVAGYNGIYQKKRFDTAGKYIEENDFVAGFEAPEPLVVKENGVHFATYMNDGAMTGVFLDQREVRKTIRDQYAKGITVLNTFSYTGAFSVFAVLGGALKTTSVDLANRSLPKTSEQFAVNGIDSETQEIRVEDVFKFFKYAARKELKYGMVILDPPSYATSKDYTFSAEKDYTSLVKEAIAITEPEGIIVASTNCSAFDMNRFKSFVNKAFAECQMEYEILQEKGLPEDFKTISEYPEGSYLKVLFIRVKDWHSDQPEV